MGAGAGQYAALLGDLEHLFQGLGDGIGAGGDGHALLPEAGGAADPLELGDDLLGSIPERMATLVRRAVASLWLGQPPARPVLVNTSQMPFSS